MTEFILLLSLAYLMIGVAVAHRVRRTQLPKPEYRSDSVWMQQAQLGAAVLLWLPISIVVVLGMLLTSDDRIDQ